MWPRPPRRGKRALVSESPRRVVQPAERAQVRELVDEGRIVFAAGRRNDECECGHDRKQGTGHSATVLHPADIAIDELEVCLALENETRRTLHLNRGAGFADGDHQGAAGEANVNRLTASRSATPRSWRTSRLTPVISVNGLKPCKTTAPP